MPTQNQISCILHLNTLRDDHWRCPEKSRCSFCYEKRKTLKLRTLDKSFDQIGKWYGISERTAERGFGELRGLRLMQEIGCKANDPFTANTYRHIWHRRTLEAYSKENRKSLLTQAKSAAKLLAKRDLKLPA